MLRAFPFATQPSMYQRLLHDGLYYANSETDILVENMPLLTPTPEQRSDKVKEMW